MEDNVLLEAISKMMDEKLAQAKKEIAHDTVALMDAEFKGKFDLLAEEIQGLRDGAADASRLEQMQDLLDLHTLMLKQHARELQKLKKAN